LVLYVFGKLGVSLPHFAAYQYNYGTHVSRDQLKPGDLVFYGNPIHHVGIYVGNGDMIDAPYPGVSVRIDPLQSDYAGATRIF
jgi:cell wall-associated NlpC family hydrolase